MRLRRVTPDGHHPWSLHQGSAECREKVFGVGSGNWDGWVGSWSHVSVVQREYDVWSWQIEWRLREIGHSWGIGASTKFFSF